MKDLNKIGAAYLVALLREHDWVPALPQLIRSPDLGRDPQRKCRLAAAARAGDQYVLI